MSMLNRICFIAVAVWMAAWTTSLHAADKWDIGFNEPFVAGYMQLINQCEQCPTNSYPASAAMMAARVGDLAGNHHVGIYREIIPVQALRPSPGVNRYDTAIDILSVYSNYNVNLVITFGLPIPAWMSVTGDRGLVMPESDTDWTTLKNTLSWEMGNFVKALWDSPRINKTWLQERVYIEGFNEFDSLLTLSNQRNRASPQRAADLQNGIQTVLNYYGIPVKTSMPSVVSRNTAALIPPLPGTPEKSTWRKCPPALRRSTPASLPIHRLPLRSPRNASTLSETMLSAFAAS